MKMNYMLQSKDMLAEGIAKQDPWECCLQKIQFRLKDTHNN